ncbi:hypothetical protein M0R45_011683 [Rubus argutus]|uniref:Myb/SANT-like DNA-binding domain-containing protein n=1 Tax=Rubus argutus TaxID=59490 RepID=A0AAW1YAV3_RUBAR
MEEELTPIRVDHTNSRWPQSEVEALILLRSNIESKFQEPGLKGPLWEQVSASMASLGYQRSAKRCKREVGEHQQVEHLQEDLGKVKENQEDDESMEEEQDTDGDYSDE